MPYRLRAMRVADLPQVMVVNRQCFSSPWAEQVFHLELTQNDQSHWVVLEMLSAAPAPARPFWKALWRRETAAPTSPWIVGFGGFWLIQGECHISNIGVATAQRGKGLGELLLLGMLQRAMVLGASWASLEVRVSNTPAIRLYEKYHYHIAQRRVAYYRDNLEDAHWMVVDKLDLPYQLLLERYERQLAQRLHWDDHFVGRRS